MTPVERDGAIIDYDQVERELDAAADRAVRWARQPKRKWKPELERDRSMRAYEQNPRAMRDA